MANIITICRIPSSILLLFFPALSPWFYVFYLISGLSDMVDGFVARKTDTVSELGSKLDSIADLIFVAVCLIKLLPLIEIPRWLWIWIALIALIKVINIVSGFICQKKFVTEHTLMNKLTGFLLFLLPLTLSFIDLKCSAILVCIIATFAAVQEGHCIRTGKMEVEEKKG